MNTTFIGGGTMAEAILARALERGVLKADAITVAEPVLERRTYLASTYDVRCTGSNAEAVDGAAMVLLAVKPQIFSEVAQDLAGRLKEGQTVMSIMAGVPITRLCTELGLAAVIRVMPNTPAKVGLGASIWTATTAVGPRERETASALLDAIGYQAYVEEEDLIDATTAISGSGPAYVFRFIEALTQAAVALRLPPKIASELVEQTLYGSALLARESSESPSRLREQVTSPGGTTEAGLKALADGGFEQVIADAANAAYQRAKELGAS